VSAWMTHWLHVMLLAGAMPILQSCVTTMASGGTTDVSCHAFEPIRWSRHDTDETIRQAKEHNAAWSALCRNAHD
jgi:hypothetical protein